MSAPLPTGYTPPRLGRQPHWPSQPLVDGRAFDLLERWAQALAMIASAMQQADNGAAYGHGQADMRTYQRGGDPTVGRLDWGPDTGEDDHDGWAGQPPRINDPEKKQLHKLLEAALGRLAYDLAWIERELRPPEQHQQQRQAG
ncbi:MAG TPA: hypothetical protein VF678_02725 [bacterium]